MRECIDGLHDLVHAFLGGVGAESDRFFRAMEFEPADFAEARIDRHVGWIAGKARACDAVLHDIEGFNHDGRNAGAASLAEEMPSQEALATENATDAAVALRLVVLRLVAFVR